MKLFNRGRALDIMRSSNIQPNRSCNRNYTKHWRKNLALLLEFLRQKLSALHLLDRNENNYTTIGRHISKQLFLKYSLKHVIDMQCTVKSMQEQQPSEPSWQSNNSECLFVGATIKYAKLTRDKCLGNRERAVL